MTIMAAQVYVKDLIDGLPVPGYQQPLSAQIKVPVPGFAQVNQPLAFVWGGVGHITRTAIPRYEGWMQNELTLGVWLLGFDQANQEGDGRFPAVIQTVAKALYSASPMPASITDPDTLDTSTLMDLGERISWEYDIDRSGSDQRLIRTLCHMEAPAMELFKA